MALVPRNDDLMTKEQMAPIMQSLESLAAKKELRKIPSAYQFFLTEKLKKGQPDGLKGFGAVSALWKTLPPKQKEAYEKMNKNAKTKKAAAEKEWEKEFTKHWDKLEKHLEAEEGEKQEKIAKRKVEQKTKKLEAKNKSASRKKQLAAEKRKRALTRGRVASIPVADRPASRVASTTRIKQLAEGLDTSIWEVRESTTRPGFFYYLNKITRNSSAERPTVKRPGSAPVPAKAARR